MSNKKGILYTCDRCGATCFCKYIGKGEADGGYTTWDKFEPAPDGWKTHIGVNVGLLCPTCEAEFQNVIEPFMKAKKAGGYRSQEWINKRANLTPDGCDGTR